MYTDVDVVDVCVDVVSVIFIIVSNHVVIIFITITNVVVFYYHAYILL